MSLAHAILAALLECSYSGYDLAKRFDGSAGFFWHASHQQIYRELSRLEAAGHLSCELVEQDSRPNKKVYSLTESGRSALSDWVNRPAKVNLIKDELLIKVFAGHLISEAKLLDELRRHYRQHRLNLEHYQTAVLRYSTDVDQLSKSQKCQYAALKAGIHHEMARLTWCEDVIRLLASDVAKETVPEKNFSGFQGES
ncbi:MAG: PadR family transcriptional regulator [Cyanobacteria bacterium J06626_23]